MHKWWKIILFNVTLGKQFSPKKKYVFASVAVCARRVLYILCPVRPELGFSVICLGLWYHIVCLGKFCHRLLSYSSWLVPSSIIKHSSYYYLRKHFKDQISMRITPSACAAVVTVCKVKEIKKKKQQLNTRCWADIWIRDGFSFCISNEKKIEKDFFFFVLLFLEFFWNVLCYVAGKRIKKRKEKLVYDF